MSTTSLQNPTNTTCYSKRATDMILYVVAKQIADSIIISAHLSERKYNQRGNTKRKVNVLQPI